MSDTENDLSFDNWDEDAFPKLNEASIGQTFAILISMGDQVHRKTKLSFMDAVERFFKWAEENSSFVSVCWSISEIGQYKTQVFPKIQQWANAS